MSKTVFEETCQKVRDFDCRDDVSGFKPGMKDTWRYKKVKNRDVYCLLQ